MILIWLDALIQGVRYWFLCFPWRFTSFLEIKETMHCISFSLQVECISMAAATYEISWILHLLTEHHIPHPQATLLLYDSQAVIYIVANLVYYEHTYKHIEVDCHLVREKIQIDIIRTLHVKSYHQLANILTKPLGCVSFTTLPSKIGAHNLHTPS